MFGSMKEIILTQGKVALVDDEDYPILSKKKWRIDKWGYARITVENQGKFHTVLMHRLILGLTDSKILTDHIDHNKLNNQKINLRTCNASQNSRNVSPRGRSKYLGVMYQKYKLPTKNGIRNYENIIARIYVNGSHIKLGTFKTEEDAARAYDAKARELFGEFANLNFK